jgi:hypothetical protein|tara:strand:- start:246 stop:449 length:204 start_codon:yes stop_codon:yes gene_type:complete
LYELKEVSLAGLGVLDDESYLHNYNMILMSTDDIIEQQCNQLQIQNRMSEFIEAKTQKHRKELPTRD